MLPFLRQRYGNPSSMHAFGGLVARDLQRAREQAAALIGADPAREWVVQFAALGWPA